MGRDTTITRPIPAQGFAEGARVPTQGWDSGHVYPLQAPSSVESKETTHGRDLLLDLLTAGYTVHRVLRYNAHEPLTTSPFPLSRPSILAGQPAHLTGAG